MTRLNESTYHVPVLLQECIQALNILPGGLYVDATMGGGGHTNAILEAAPPGTSVVAFDADEFAVKHCALRFIEATKPTASPHLRIVHANFATMPEEIKRLSQPVNGVLFDLGVSSFQFDHHERGFSFRAMAPLDMRFAPSGETAADILNSRTDQELASLFREYADEPQAWRIAKAVVQRRRLAPFASTADVRDLVVREIPPQHQPKTMARLFQALRIAVNDELGVLERTLTAVIPLLAPAGRIVVMSYHSGEDRIVKSVFRAHSNTLKIITKKAVEASPAEVAANPRARSAKLRIAEAVGS